MSSINLEIITPEKVSYNNTVNVITVPGTKGNFQILKDHAPLMSTIEIGVIIVKKDEDVIYLTTGSGTIEVLNNDVLILVESIENVNEIDVERAERAKQRAKDRLARKNIEDIDVARAEIALKRAINRISASSKVAS